jgi:surface antigen
MAMRNRFKFQLSVVAASAVLLATGPASAIDPKATNDLSTPVLSAVDDGQPRRGFLSGIFGCTASGNKQTIGTVAGGVLGGFLGNRIAGRGSRVIGTVLGGALGAAAGSALGCKMQRSDQAKAERATEEAIATGKDQSWENPETGASGKVEVGANGTALNGIKFAKGIEPAESYSKIGGAFVSTANANVRSGPGTASNVVSTLPTGTRVWVPASVTGSPWMLISDGGVGQGYVSNALLKKVSTETASNCKMVKQTVSLPGNKDETETMQACKGADGQWVMTRV